MGLASFLDLLNTASLVDVTSITDEDGEGFSNRFRIQKYTYLARSFGLDLGYGYSIYRYGPYSPSLAEHYYELGENLDIFDMEREEPLPDTFQSEDFLSLVSDKNDEWLEIATTLIDQKSRFNNDHDLVNHVEAIKCNYSTDYINNVLTSLRTERLL